MAVCTPPYPVVVSGLPPRCAGAVADHLVAAALTPTGAVGPTAEVAAFAAAWSARTGQRSVEVMPQRLYRLGRLRPPTGVPGHPVLATEADLRLLVDWRKAFEAEAKPHAAHSNHAPDPHPDQTPGPDTDKPAGPDPGRASGPDPDRAPGSHRSEAHLAPAATAPGVNSAKAPNPQPDKALGPHADMAPGPHPGDAPGPHPDDAESMVRGSFLAGSGQWLWRVRGEPVAMAVVGIPQEGMSRIGPVYTPLAHRGRGYGSAVTAAAGQHALDLGAEHVVLFTDLANPVSNSIYQRIGFLPVGDAVEVGFDQSGLR